MSSRCSTRHKAKLLDFRTTMDVSSSDPVAHWSHLNDCNCCCLVNYCLKRTIPGTRMHFSRMRTARSSSRARGVSTRQPPRTRHPPGSRHPSEQEPPWEQTPQTRHPPGTRQPPGADPPPVDRITDACENITLPQLRCGR